MIKKLSWDTDFFGIEVGQISINDDEKVSNVDEFDLLYAISAVDFDLKIEGFEKSFSETKITFSKELKPEETSTDHISSISETSYNLESLYELAFESGKHSRFLLDKRFTLSKFQSLYKMWIDNSISGGFATDILLYKINSEILGLLTYKTKDHNASVGLFAISQNAQGQGIGSVLLKNLEQILYRNGVKVLEIPTQESNNQACSFYKKAGYDIVDKISINHFWKNNDTI